MTDPSTDLPVWSQGQVERLKRWLIAVSGLILEDLEKMSRAIRLNVMSVVPGEAFSTVLFSTNSAVDVLAPGGVVHASRQF